MPSIEHRYLVVPEQHESHPAAWFLTEDLAEARSFAKEMAQATPGKKMFLFMTAGVFEAEAKLISYEVK